MVVLLVVEVLFSASYLYFIGKLINNQLETQRKPPSTVKSRVV